MARRMSPISLLPLWGVFGCDMLFILARVFVYGKYVEISLILSVSTIWVYDTQRDKNVCGSVMAWFPL